ncbi:hypothetical protein ZYGR_0BB00670 [Zygosaccharomyces rouxii]|uniref:Hyphally-regulated cell wall protein N-terminal domain-containing protein n=1 Tax=Zygosaccharomyces rouxii TaxID=4956 RepID=A0A1Q3AKX3_ZYGRO|nr:hypothetical protein ZYGR_0BB00670 [Zygosaccharomyces rouxii]
MNVLPVVFVLASIAGVIADSTVFRPIVRSLTDNKLNGLTVYASGDAVLVGNGGDHPTLSHLNDCGAFAVDGNDYAGDGESGFFAIADATSAAFGFAIRGGKLTYKNNNEFYVVQKGSGYRLSIRGGTKITINAEAIGGDSSVIDFAPTGICHGQHPQSATVSPSASGTGSPGVQPSGKPGGLSRGTTGHTVSGFPGHKTSNSPGPGTGTGPGPGLDTGTGIGPGTGPANIATSHKHGSGGWSKSGPYQNASRPIGGRTGRPNSIVHPVKRVARVSIPDNEAGSAWV